MRFWVYSDGGVLLFFCILLSFLFFNLFKVDKFDSLFVVLGLFGKWLGYFNWIMYFNVLMVILIGFDFSFVYGMCIWSLWIFLLRNVIGSFNFCKKGYNY